MRIVLDVENSTSKKEGKSNRLDMSPFTAANQLVAVGIKDIDTNWSRCFIFNHREKTDSNAYQFTGVNALLKRATLIIGHNLKHDLNWCRASNLVIPENVEFWDTSIAEYVLAKGQVHRSFRLEDLAEAMDLPRKKVDLIQGYYDQGLGMYDIPLPILEEYNIGDLTTTEALYTNQLERLALPQNKSLLPTIKMLNEFMYVLAKWTANGIKIDLEELSRVEVEFRTERDELIKVLTEIAKEYLGDTPFNLNSGEDKSVLIYSRRVVDKKKWAETFNIGTDDRGKKLRRARMKPAEFIEKVRELTNVEKRTKAVQCPGCEGRGFFIPPLKSGLPGKARRICKTCSKAGVLYEPTGRVAGFKFSPESVKDCGVNGFSTEADKLEYLLPKSQSEDATKFLSGLMRLNQLNTYISTFVEGIKAATRKESGILYTNFNQIVTATGRLSSSDPNFQNIPRGTTFPVKRAIISRFPGGRIFEADYAQLEFRCAGELSGDKQIFKDIADGVDVHAFTRDTLNKADGGKRDRQAAKSETFKPVYGGTYGTPAQMAYYAAFKKKYSGLTEWQERISNGVLKYGYYELPTGRQYAWAGVKREWDGRPTFFTQIVNYPVQGFATGDIVPLACILLQSSLEQRGLKSVGFLTVHDSIAVDCYPGEEKEVSELVLASMLGVKEELLKRYGYTFKIPLEVEGKLGYNMFSMEKVAKVAHKQPGYDMFDDPLEDIGK